MKFYDMDGKELNVGDCVKPIEGRELLIISKGNIDEYPDEVLIGQQIEDIAAFSILTAENLTTRFKKSKSGSSSASNEAEEILNIIMGDEEA